MQKIADVKYATAVLQWGPEIAAGNNRNLLQWLRQHIHVHGRYYTPEELCKHATGRVLNSNFFMDYANKKYAGMYTA
jgi:carboxypeptidase Taq